MTSPALVRSGDLSACPFLRPVRVRSAGAMNFIDDATGEQIFETDNEDAAHFVAAVLNKLNNGERHGDQR